MWTTKTWREWHSFALMRSQNYTKRPSVPPKREMTSVQENGVSKANGPQWFVIHLIWSRVGVSAAGTHGTNMAGHGCHTLLWLRLRSCIFMSEGTIAAWSKRCCGDSHRRGETLYCPLAAQLKPFPVSALSPQSLPPAVVVTAGQQTGSPKNISSTLLRGVTWVIKMSFHTTN